VVVSNEGVIIMPRWRFLTNHALVLRAIANNPKITGPELAAEVRITERGVRYIIAHLEAEGYITKKRIGRRLKFRINPDLTMRHKMYQDTAVGDFLKSLGQKKKRGHIKY